MVAEASPFRLIACRELMEKHPESLRIREQVEIIEASVPGTRLWVRETWAAQGTGVGSGLIRIKDRIRQAYMADMESRSCC